MFIIGVCSLFQCWLLPGLLILYKLKNLNLIDKIILSLPVSIVCNYIITILLINLKLFNQNVLIFIFVFELLALFYLYQHFLFDLFKIKIIKINFNLLNSLNIALIFIVLILAVNSLGEIIYPGDPYVMWNDWAISIFKNNFPSNNHDYPIGYPILQAISYKMINTYQIEFFARSIQIIYPLFSIIVLIRVIKITNEHFFNYVLLFFLLLSLNQFRHTLFIGFVDTILVFCSTLLIYLIYLIKKNKQLLLNNYFIIILAIVLCTPGLIKQTGLYLTFISPIFLYYFLEIKFNKKNLKNLITIYFAITILVAPWYIYKIILFMNDIGSSNALNLISLQEDRIFSEKILRTLKLIFGLSVYIVLPLILISLIKKNSQKFIILIILPYYLIWSFLYGNDARNFALMLPFIAFVIAEALIIINHFFFKKTNISSILSVFIIVILIFFINEKRDKDYMLRKNQELSHYRTLHAKTNILINHYKDKIIKNNELFFSDNSFLNLPKFKYAKFLPCNSEAVNFLKNKKNKIFYLYNKNKCSKEFLNSIFTINNMNEVFNQDDFVLVGNN